MNMMKHIFHHELLLLRRNTFLLIPFIVNILIWGYVIASHELTAVYYKERAAAFYDGFIWILLLNLLIVGLFSVYLASKDRESEFEQIMATYRVKNTEWMIGKWLAAQLYGLCLTMTTVIVQAIWLLTASISKGEWLQHLIYVFIQMGGGLFFLISLGFLFGIIMKSMFAYLVIPVVIVLSLLMPFDSVGTSLTYDNPKLHLFTPFDYMFIDSPYEGVWGIDRVFGSTIIHQSGVLFFGVVLLFVTVFLFRRNRAGKREKRLVPITIIAFLIPTLILSSIRFQQYDQALKEFIKTGKNYAQTFDGVSESDHIKWWNDYYNYFLDDERYELSMEKAHLTIDLENDDRIRVESILTIKNNGKVAVKDVDMTLYHGLTINECKSPLGVTCAREDDTVTLHFEKEIQPKEEVSLSFHYGGNILQYRDDAKIEQAFVQKNRVYLPKEAGWYPLIGKRPLVIAREHDKHYVTFELRNGRLVEDTPTAFTVNVMGENNHIPLALTIPEVSKGVYEGITSYGLSLIGGNLTEISVGDTRLVAHPEILSGAKKVVNKYEKAWEFVEEWLDVSFAPSVVYVLDKWHYYLTNSTVNQDFFTLNSGELEHIDASDIAYEITNNFQHIFYDGEHQELNYLYDAIVWAIENHLVKEMTFKQWYMANRWWDEIPQQVKLLHDYEEDGHEELYEVVKFLFKYADRLEDKHKFDLETALKLYERETRK